MENKEQSTFEYWLQKHVEDKNLNSHMKKKTQPVVGLRY